MTDGEVLLLVFALIYLSECLVWLTPTSYALVAWWSRRHTVTRAAMHFSALGRGIALLQPLPPFGSVFVGQAWPVSPLPDGLSLLSRETPNLGPAREGARRRDSAAWFAWETIQGFRADASSVRIETPDPPPPVACATAAHAVQLACDLEVIRRADPDARSRVIDRILRRSFRARRAGRKAAFFRRATAPLRLNQCVLFVAVFVGLPLSYWRFHDEPRFFIALGGTWLMMALVAIDGFLLHRRFYPRLASDRWQHLILSLIFPHYTLRTLDTLSKGFLADCHPTAMAAALADEPLAMRFLATVARDAHWPVPLVHPDATAVSAADAFRLRFFQPGFLAAFGPQDRFAAIRPSDDNYPAHCPRCGTDYRAEGLPCDDCGGIRTVAAQL